MTPVEVSYVVVPMMLRATRLPLDADGVSLKGRGGSMQPDRLSPSATSDHRRYESRFVVREFNYRRDVHPAISLDILEMIDLSELWKNV
jgi:hypothetical protein